MTTQPSPLGRGWTGAAPLPAAPGRAFARRRATHTQAAQSATARRRVRGLFLSSAQQPGRGLSSFRTKLTPHPPAGRSRLCGLGVGSPSAGEGPSGCGW